MEAKHTPGPWLYHKATNQVHVKHGATVAEVMPHYMNQIADGQLIAAAPLLLEALQMAFDRDLTYLSDAAVIPRQDVVRARLAIHAALGVTANEEEITMELETVNKLYLELSQVATAKTARELKLEDLLTSARAIAQRGGEATAWDRFDAAVAKAGVGSVTAKVFKVLPSDGQRGGQSMTGNAPLYDPRAVAFGAAERDPHGTDAHQPGAKLDAGKARAGLVLGDFARALQQVSLVGTFGAQKYTDHGWLTVPAGIERYTDAMLRHWLAEHYSAPHDSQTGLLHAAHLAWNALARLELQLRALKAQPHGATP